MCHEKSIMSRAQSTPCVQHKQKSKMYKVQISIDGNSESVISWQDCTRTKQNDRWKLTRDKLTNERTDETRMQRWNYCTSKSIRSDDWNEEQKSRKQGWQDGNETQTSKEKLIEVGWSWVKSSEVEWSQVEYTAYKCADRTLLAGCSGEVSPETVRRTVSASIEYRWSRCARLTHRKQNEQRKCKIEKIKNSRIEIPLSFSHS